MTLHDISGMDSQEGRLPKICKSSMKDLLKAAHLDLKMETSYLCRGS